MHETDRPMFKIYKILTNKIWMWHSKCEIILKSIIFLIFILLQRSFELLGIPSTTQRGIFVAESSKPRTNIRKVAPTKSRNGLRRVDRRRRENIMMNSRMEEKKILDKILGKGEYDPRIRPAGVYNNTGNIGTEINRMNNLQ